MHSCDCEKIAKWNAIFTNITNFKFYILCNKNFFRKWGNDKSRIFGKGISTRTEYISSKEDIEKVCEGFKKINKQGIKGTNCSLFVKIMIKVVIFNVLALIF